MGGLTSIADSSCEVMIGSSGSSNAGDIDQCGGDVVEFVFVRGRRSLVESSCGDVTTAIATTLLLLLPRLLPLLRFVSRCPCCLRSRSRCFRCRRRCCALLLRSTVVLVDDVPPLSSPEPSLLLVRGGRRIRAIGPVRAARKSSFVTCCVSSSASASFALPKSPLPWGKISMNSSLHQHQFTIAPSCRSAHR